MRVFPTRENKENKFIETVNKEGMSVVMIGAPWASVNEQQRDEFFASKDLFEEHEIEFLELDLTKAEEMEMALRFQTNKIPAIFIMRDGEIEHELTGLVSEGVITSTINSYRQEKRR